MGHLFSNIQFWLFLFLFTMDYKYEFFWLLSVCKECNSHKKERTLPARTRTQGCISEWNHVQLYWVNNDAQQFENYALKNTKIQYSTSQKLFFLILARRKKQKEITWARFIFALEVQMGEVHPTWTHPSLVVSCNAGETNSSPAPGLKHTWCQYVNLQWACLNLYHLQEINRYAQGDSLA